MNHTRGDGRHDANYLVATDMGATINGPTLDTLSHPRVNIHTVFEGANTPSGTVRLQLSGDGVTWANVTDTDQAVSAAGDHMIDWVTGARYARLQYEVTSGGAGDNMTATATLKGA